MSQLPAKLALRNVSHHYRDGGRQLNVLQDIAFEVAAGEFVTIIGPSGSGKSTIFKIIAGLIQAQQGEVAIDGRVTHNRLGKTAYMAQQDGLLPWRTVLDNVLLGPEVNGQNRREAHQRALELLPLFGLRGFEKRFPAQLSGGMRQRAALLRTFLAGQDLLLLDEPFGALDALTRRDLQDWLLDVWQHFSYTIVFITHDVAEAVFLSDRVLVLSERPGRLVQNLEVSLQRPRRQHYAPYAPPLLERQATLYDALRAHA